MSEHEHSAAFDIAYGSAPIEEKRAQLTAMGDDPEAQGYLEMLALEEEADDVDPDELEDAENSLDNEDDEPDGLEYA